MADMELSGAVPPLVTPTTNDRAEVDRQTLRSFTEFLVDGGVHALFPCGSIGEFSSLTRKQRSTVIETVVEAAVDTPVLAGCGGTGVSDVRELISDAEAAGADAAVVVTPYYLTTNSDGLVAFYERVARGASLPILLYDIPSLTGNELPVETVEKLAAHDNVVGVKDSTGDFTHHQELIEATPASFTVFQGLAEFAVPALDVGADGFVAGPANVYPSAVSSAYDAYRNGERNRAVELWKAVMNPVVAATKPLPTAAGLKHLLACHGRDVGEPFPPLSTPSQSQCDRLERYHDRVSQYMSNELSIAE
jgi:4-hydroxy-tetrahydrodipicolinate synthase